MSHLFLLDENVLVWPIEAGGRTQGGLRAARLWVEIARNCHRVLLSPRLFARYMAHLSRLRSRLSQLAPIPGFDNLLRQVIHGKGEWVTDEQAVSEEQCIRHLNDRYLARIAIQRPGCLVVSLEGSRETLEDFRRPEFARHGIRALDLEEALQLAGQAGP